ncbi:MAG: PD-(D/E)XK nuclease family protein [Verrucomicrobia bacterium]|nr:PD-(D/E)XK nuclease family protein [Verrucomicrobiota bacterium]
MEDHPNIFNVLFQFHPRDGHTPKENFLTEAFAHILRTEVAVSEKWLALTTGTKLSADDTLEIETQRTEVNPATGNAVYFDLFVSVAGDDDRSFQIVCEHKWDSGADVNQLETYAKILHTNSQRGYLIFVGATDEQKRAATGFGETIQKYLPVGRYRVLLWRELYDELTSIQQPSALLIQLLAFMKTQGLGPSEPLTIPRMVNYLEGAGLVDILERYANRLLNSKTEYDWSVLPARYRSEARVKKAYGRMAIEFITEGWKPTVAVGFLYDTYDHRVQFVNPANGIDLMLRVETSPSNQRNIKPAMDVLTEKKRLLAQSGAKVLLHKEPGNGNNHTLLIARACLGDVIQNSVTEEDQLREIYKKLVGWCEILFQDGSLEKALAKSF